RPRRVREQEYLVALTDAVSLGDWQAIVKRAVEAAKANDAKARDWLAKYLVGEDPLSLVELSEELEAVRAALEESGDARNHRRASEGSGPPAGGGAGAGCAPLGPAEGGPLGHHPRSGDGAGPVADGPATLPIGEDVTPLFAPGGQESDRRRPGPA